MDSKAAREVARFASLLWLCLMAPADCDIRTAAGAQHGEGE
jgi:hypothetical protein